MGWFGDGLVSFAGPLQVVVLDFTGSSTVARRAYRCLRDSLTAVCRGSLWGEGLAIRVEEKVQFVVLKLRRDEAGIQERGMRLLPLGLVEKDNVDFDLACSGGALDPDCGCTFGLR